ncbi:MAG: hypothetical protein U0790_01805 [Isosphaeraceae bacterium]
MRKRAYRPEIIRYLEDRSLLSVAGGLSAHPVVLPRLRFIKISEHIDSSFLLFGRNHDPRHLRQQVRDVIVWIPFGRVDGLGASINRIVDRMVAERSSHDPRIISAAGEEVLAVTRETVMARVRAGDVVIR